MYPDIYEIETKIIEVLAGLRIKAELSSFSYRYTCVRCKFKLITSPRISMERLMKAEALVYKEIGILVKIRVDKGMVVAELPNPNAPIFSFSSVKNRLKNTGYALPLALGLTDYGRSVIIDLCEMPHMLIAGSSPEGQTNLLNVLISSILEVRASDEVKFILVDIEGKDFDKYSDSLYLMEDGLIKDLGVLFEALEWLDYELLRRYLLLADNQSRNIREYNEKACEKLPYIVFIVKDIVPVMKAKRNDFETYLCKIAAKAKAAGIHIILASSKASTEIITGTIKNNMPARIAFSTDTALQSRIIIDNVEAMYLKYPDDILYMLLCGKEMKWLKVYRVDYHIKGE